MAHHYLSTALTPSVRRAQEAYYGRSQHVPPAPGPDALGEDEQFFIQSRDSFYLATVTEDGWPYIQHRGGPPGFLKVLDAHTLGFADFSGNRQLLTTGNVAANDRVALFLMDYPQRTRLKLNGHAEVIAAKDDPALAAEFAPVGVPERAVERMFRIRVTGFDWNCPKFITPRFTTEEIEEATAPLKRRVAELEAKLAAAGRATPPT